MFAFARTQLSLLCLSLAALALLSGPRRLIADEKDSKSLYLSIGLGRYQDSRWPKLQFSNKDASDIDASLKGSFNRGLLLNDDSNPQGVTRSHILAAIEQLRVQNTREDDTVIVYISTHGTMARELAQGEYKIKKFLVTADTRYDEVASTALSFDALLEAFGALKSRRKALIIDSCYSGGGKAVLSPSMIEFIAKQKAGVIREPSSDRIEGFGVYAASSWGEEAQENPDLKNGVYTHFLLKGFQEDMNGDGAVQLSEAHNFASNAVMDFTRGAQHPSARVEIVGIDPVIVKGRLSRMTKPSIFTWSWDLRPVDILFNGAKVGSMGKGFTNVPAGPGQIEVYDPKQGKVIAKRQIEFRNNETYSLESLLAKEELNNLSLSYKLWQNMNADLQKSLLPSARRGPEVKYLYRGIFGGSSDLSLQIQYLVEQNETVRMNQRFGPWTRTLNAQQSLDGWRIGLGWGIRRRINGLSLFPKAWTLHWQNTVNASQLQLDRTTLFADIEGSMNEHLRFYAVSGEQSLRLSFPSTSWNILAAVELGAMENPFHLGKVNAFWSLSLGGGFTF